VESSCLLYYKNKYIFNKDNYYLKDWFWFYKAMKITYETVMRPASNALFDDDDGFCVDVTIGSPCGQARGLRNSKYCKINRTLEHEFNF
jgi:hypothetical protein